MYEGQVTATFEAPGPGDLEAIGLHMTGGGETEDAAPDDAGAQDAPPAPDRQPPVQP